MGTNDRQQRGIRPPADGIKRVRMGTGTDLTNPALADLGFLVGPWELTLSNASFLPEPDDVVAGRVEVVPIEGGRLLAIRQVSDSPGPPLATWVIGRDDGRAHYTVLYIDDRVVSRVYEMSLTEDRWTIWRDDPDFSQRFEATISADRQMLEGRWEKRVGSGPWEHDFNLTYSRGAHRSDPAGTDS
jgi:hypothetical protein